MQQTRTDPRDKLFFEVPYIEEYERRSAIDENIASGS